MIPEYAQLHLAILGTRDCYCIVAKNHGTNKTMTLWLKKEEVIDQAKHLNEQGFTVWVSLNDKEQGDDTTKGVRALQDLWFDIDSKRKDKSMPATKEELEDALVRANKLLKSVEERYGAIGFMALSGNGFHLHFPLPRFELVGEKFREEVNEKLRAFAKRLASAAGVEIDKTYDIRRVTTLIGSYNLKIPGLPLQTAWDKTVFDQGFDSALKAVEEARVRNKALLEAILNEPIGSQAQPALVQSRDHPPLEELLNKDEKLKDLYEGEWQKYGYPSRSEAEMALVTKLVFYGFSDDEIKAAMDTAKIGKWQEKEESYKNLTIKKAREKISEKIPGGYISQLEEGKEERKSQADRLVEIGLAAELFVDDEGEPYAAFTIDTHREVWPIRSKAFKQWLSLQYFKENGKAPNTDALNQALLALEGKAIFEGGRRKLWLRVGIGEAGALYYDLGDPQWRVVKITPESWEVVNSCPVYFKRYQNMDAQVEPEPGGSLSMLFEIAQLSSEGDSSDNSVGDDNTTILLCALPALLIPEIPKPIINTVGEKGSGKTIFYKLIRQLLDPAREPLLSLRRDERELAIQLHHNYLPAFDNVGAIGALTSDMLCRAATGAGFSTRALYTDEEERIFRIKRGILINGIHPLDGQTDLQDRLLLIELKRIPKQKRKKEEEILAEFEKVRGKLFGAVLTALAKGMACYSRVKLNELPRMADFAVWCAAIAEGIGIGAETFMNVLWRNLGRINEKVLETHPLAMAINSLLPEEGRIECTPTELLERLEEEAEKLKLNLKSEHWPKSTISLGRSLRELISNLEEAGIKVEFRREGNKGRRVISLQKSKAKSVSSVSLSVDDKNLHGRLKTDTDRLPDGSQTDLSVDLSVETDDKDPSKTAQLITDRSDRCLLTLSAEACSNCQDFAPQYKICSLDGQPKDPGFSCRRFQPKPRLFKCKCGAGPWRDRRLADEHIYLCRNEPGHEIKEA